MARIHSGEDVLDFTPVLKGNGAFTGLLKGSRVSPYRFALFVHDLFMITAAFGLGTWVSGVSFFLWNRPIQAISLLIFALIVISFFPTYNLYSYHYIFLRKSHLINLIKAYFWGAFTIGIVLLIYTYPQFLQGKFAIFFLFFVAIVLLLLSRFISDYLLTILKAIGLGFLAIGVMGFLYPEEIPIVMEYWIGVPIGFSFAAGMVLGSRFLLVHVIFSKWLRRHFRRQVAIVGSDEEATEITNYIIERNAPYWVCGFVDSHELRDWNMPAQKKWLGEIKDLPAIIKREKIEEIILTDETIDKRTLISLLDYCTSRGITIWFPPKLMPIIDMKLYIDRFCNLPMVRLCSQKHTYIFNKIKHSLDALIALPAFIVLLPIFLLIGIIIKLDSRGPVLYRSKAIGKGGRAFTMYKFRSMRIESGNEIHKQYVAKLINGNVSEDSGKGGVFKVAEDPRITRVGNVLRKFSLDELPQIINIIKGEMSLVGPRPCLPYEYEMYKDWHKKRLSIRPGITCIWQVAGRSAVSFEDLVLLDLYYIYNRSILMDMNILYETIFAVLGKRGAY